MIIKIVFAVIAGGLAIAGNVPYLRDIFRGRITPHPCIPGLSGPFGGLYPYPA